MIDPFDSYKLYNALKLHFEGSYDAVKYNFKTNASPNSFFKRKDKYFFAKLAKNQKDLMNFYVYNFVEDVKYITEMQDRYYTKHKKIHESLTRTFQADINKLAEEYSFDELLQAGPNNQAPKIVEKWMHEEITLETLVIMNALTSFVYWEGKKITETIFWPDLSRKITKYEPFVKFDRDKYINIVKKAFTIG